MLNGSHSMHAVGDEGVSVTSLDGQEVLHIVTLDTALVSPGKPTPFPNPRRLPDLEEGVAFNLVNNVWVSGVGRVDIGAVQRQYCLVEYASCLAVEQPAWHESLCTLGVVALYVELCGCTHHALHMLPFTSLHLSEHATMSCFREQIMCR